MILSTDRTDWAITPLSILCKTIVGGGTPSTKISEYWAGSIPWISSADIDSSNRISPRRFITSEAIGNSATNLVPKDTLIVVTRVGLGKLALAPFDLCFSQDNQGLIFHDNVVCSKYALYFLTIAVNNLKGRGTTINGITKKQLQDLKFHLPPIPEQRYLVAKIEQLFSELDKGVELLNTLLQQLKVYRQAVLKAAFEGTLNNIDQCDIIRLEDLCEFITKGTTPSKELLSSYGDIPFIKVYNLTLTGALDFSINPTFVPLNTHQCFLSRSKVLPGDVIMNIVGPPLGKVSMVPPLYPEWNINQAIARFRCKENLHNRFLAYFLMSDYTIEILKGWSKATAGQFNLTLEICRNIKIPLFKIEDQYCIVQEIESRLSVADKLEETIAQTVQQAEALRQSILKKAFEGNLLSAAELEEVRLDPDWEPASVLLEKIKAKKAAADTSKPPAEKSARKGKKQS